MILFYFRQFEIISILFIKKNLLRPKTKKKRIYQKQKKIPYRECVKKEIVKNYSLAGDSFSAMQI
jgi:hypothetical protein